MPCLDGGLSPARNVMTDLTVGQPIPAALHRISTGSGRSPRHEPIGDVDRHLGERRERDHRFLIFAIAANAARAASFMPPGPVQSEHHALRGAVVARADARADLIGDFFQDAANFRLALRVSPKRAAAYARRRWLWSAIRGTSAAEYRAAARLSRQARRRLSARLTRLMKPFSEMRAPRLSATLRATSRSPRRTSTSVTASPSAGAPRSPADGPGSWFSRDRPDRPRPAAAQV